MSGQGKEGPAAVWHKLPCTPSGPPYPVQQGGSRSPRGAPVANKPPPPPFQHSARPSQPYIPAWSVPQAPAPRSRSNHGPAPYGQAPVDQGLPPQGPPPYSPVFPVGYGEPPLLWPPYGRQVVYPPGVRVPDLPMHRSPPGGTELIEGKMDVDNRRDCSLRLIHPRLRPVDTLTYRPWSNWHTQQRLPNVEGRPAPPGWRYCQPRKRSLAK